MKYRDIDQELKRKIDLYVGGELDNEQVDELWTELVHDSRALGYLKTVADINEIDDEEHEERIQTTTNQKQTQNYWYLSVALVLIAGVFIILQFEAETTDSVQPITSIELNSYRSVDGIVGDEAMLREAIELANQGEYDVAVRLIDVELNRTDDVYTKSLLLIQSGSILYNASRYREALSRFDRVTKNRETDLLMQERAYWCLGNTYFQLGELEAAKVAFQNAYELDGAYSRVAEKYLVFLNGEEE